MSPQMIAIANEINEEQQRIIAKVTSNEIEQGIVNYAVNASFGILTSEAMIHDVDMESIIKKFETVIVELIPKATKLREQARMIATHGDMLQ